MQVYIMRHGQAFISGNADALRELTSEGKQEVNKMAKWIAEQKIYFDEIIVSPFVRAQETVNELSRHLDKEIKKTTLDFITPMGLAKQMHDYIDGVCTQDHVNHLLIVSHMPLVSYLTAELTVDADCPIFQTAAIVHIDYDTKLMKGKLVSLTSPNELS